MAVNARIKTEPGDSNDKLAERPSLLTRLSPDYQFSPSAYIGAEAVHTGKAYSMNDTGEMEDLAVSTLLHLYANYPLSTTIEIYLQANNVTDAFVKPQLRLPAPGRTLMGGIRIRL